MTYEQFEQLAGGIESLVTIAAIIIGGFWAYRRFIRQRENYPYIEFTVDINFIGCKAEYWIVELIALFKNKGKVQHKIEKFEFDLAALYPKDSVRVSERFGGQVLFPHEIAKGSWLPPEWGYTFIDPGVETHYSYVTRVPIEATFLIMHSWFHYPKPNWYHFTKRKKSHSAEKTVIVPSCVSKNSKAP